MAKSNSTATTFLHYHLPAARRQAILEKSDNPAGQISSARLKVIARQRFKFIQMNDCDGTKSAA